MTKEFTQAEALALHAENVTLKQGVKLLMSAQLTASEGLSLLAQALKALQEGQEKAALKFAQAANTKILGVRETQAQVSILFREDK